MPEVAEQPKKTPEPTQADFEKMAKSAGSTTKSWEQHEAVKNLLELAEHGSPAAQKKAREILEPLAKKEKQEIEKNGKASTFVLDSIDAIQSTQAEDVKAPDTTKMPPKPKAKTH